MHNTLRFIPFNDTGSLRKQLCCSFIIILAWVSYICETAVATHYPQLASAEVELTMSCDCHERVSQQRGVWYTTWVQH